MAVAAKLFTPSKPSPVENGVRTKLFLFRVELNKTSQLYNRLSRENKQSEQLLSPRCY